MRSKTLTFGMLLGAALLAGCGGSGDTGDNTRDVVIDTVVTYWTDGGARSEAPLDTPGIAIELVGDSRVYAAVPDATRRRWTATGVPAGPYRVRFRYDGGDLVYVEVPTGASTLDLGRDRAGRADAQVLTAATPVSVALSGLAPWAEGNYVDLSAWNADAMFWPRAAVATGATSGATVPLDWRGWAGDGKRLLPADTIWVLQHRDGFVHAGSGDTYELAVAAGSASGIGMTDGVALTVPVAMTTQPSGSGSVRLNWKKSQFFAQFDPATSNGVGYVSVNGQPAPRSVAGPGVYELGLSTRSRADVDYGRLDYNRFLPASYRESFSTLVYATVPRTLPGTTTAFDGEMVVWRSDPIDALPDPLVPLVGLPTAVTVNGRNASQPVTGAGLTPTIAWQPPTVGSATSYRLSVSEIGVTASGPYWTAVANWILPGRSLTLPPGLLAAGKVYVFSLMAEADPTGPGLAAPLRHGAGSRGHGTYDSNTFQP